MLVGVIGNTTDFDSVILGSSPKPVTKQIFMKEQVCTKCKVKKLSTDFSKDRKATTGRCSHCKKCMAEYKKSRKEQQIVAFSFF